MLGWLAVWGALVWAMRRKRRVRLLRRKAVPRELDATRLVALLPWLRGDARVHRTLEGVAPYDRVARGGRSLRLMPWTTVDALRAWLRGP